MERGKVKKIIFGSIYLGILFLIMGGIYFFTLKPTPSCFDNKQNQDEEEIDCGGSSCIVCAIKNAQLLKATLIKKISDSGQSSLVFEIKNPNLNAGVSDFIYTLDIFDVNNGKIKTESGRSFIYPGEVKYLLSVLDIKSSEIYGAEMSFSDITWEEKSDFSKPAVKVKELKTEIYNPQTITIPLYDFSRELYSGIKGEDVSNLEEYLRVKGFFSATPDQDFDKVTKAALTKFQQSNSLSPADGYFGGETRDFVNDEIENIKKSISETAQIYPATVSGIIKNDDIIRVSKVIVTGMLYDKWGSLVGASKTELENLSPTDEKSFKLVFPQSINVSTINSTLTKVYVDSIK